MAIFRFKGLSNAGSRAVHFLPLLVIFFAPAAQAQDLRVSAFGGASFLKGDRTFVVAGDSKRSNFANGGKIGFRLTGNLTEHWGVEGAYSYGTNNLRIFDVRTTGTVERAFGNRVRQFAGNALYYFSGFGGSVRPFVTGGVGLVRYSPTSKAKTAAAVEFVDEPATITVETKAAFNYGGGVEAKLPRNLGVRFDLRDNISSIPRFGVPQAPTAGIADFFPVSGAVHDVEFSVSLVFHLR